MIQDWVQDVAEMHAKFGLSGNVARMRLAELREFLRFRVRFVAEESIELRDAEWEMSPEGVVDALIDLCVVAIGTLEAFGVDGHEAWRRVHAANMAKVPGVNEARPNPFGLPDLVKPAGWVAPDHSDNVGLLARLR